MKALLRNQSTSPSVYLEVVGPISVTDQCGPLGSTLTNPFIAFAPGALQTFDPPWPMTQGQIFDIPQGFVGGPFLGSVNPLKIPELECPTFGVGKSTSGGKVVTTVGPPWLPLIIPASQAFSLDPEWSKFCPGILSASGGLSTFAIFDPPHALRPGDGMAVDPTKPLPAGQTPEAPLLRPILLPGSAPKPDSPKQTAAAGNVMVDPGAGQDPASGAQTSPAGSTNDSPTPVVNNDPSQPEQGRNPAGLPANGNQPNGPAAQPPTNLEPSKPSLAEAILRGWGNDAADKSKRPPAQNNNAGIPPAQPNAPASNNFPAANPPDAAPQILTVGTQTFTPNPTGFNIGPQAVNPGAPAVTIAGTPISLDLSSNLAVGPSTFQLAPPVTPAYHALSVGTQTFTPNPAGFQIGAQIVSPGGPAITAAGTPVSLDAAGHLALGPTTLSLAPSPSPVFTLGTQTVSANAAGFAVAGTTVAPGGPAVTISGTAVSLGSSGNLIVGSSTIVLPTSDAASSQNIISIAGQTITASPRGFDIRGSSVQPGGSAVTVAGTVVSLGTDGVLDIGGSKTSLVRGTNTGAPSLYQGHAAARAASLWSWRRGIMVMVVGLWGLV